MPSLAFIWLQFAVSLLLIGFAGTQLTRYGDAIADKTGIGATWIGVVLLASVTSLPELVTGLSSVTLAGVPEIAVGDVLGSCVFNLLILVLLDVIYRRETIYTHASQGHILSAGFGIMLLGFVGFNLLLASNGARWSVAHVGAYTPVLLLIYAVAMRTVFRYEQREVGRFTEEVADQYPHLTLAQVILRYAAAAAVVVAAGVWLPYIAESMAVQMDWHQTFVGTLMVALVTSVPEMVVTVAALRLGALDMAIGNLLGSNLFNVMILAVDDIAYLDGPLLSAVSPIHAASALSAMMMTGIAIVGLLYRPRTRVLRTVGWASIVLFAVYLLNSYVLYLYHG